ncbi:helix-turn-helix domain-containing protein [Ahrensia sp. 13_GOM-1096m]|uniref:helix-turn-helix domain-containing protein n=1 Tax=Ahrensia sp. 13_GOM-1096m TaxID=1380380 RepID=UPI000478B545|nr:helix-turn-helix domain-containing protein [Ahrensia sp. 13_GOM-1096m]
MREPYNHATRIDAAIARNEAAYAPLVASWQRSKKLHDLNPDKRSAPERLTQAEFNIAREQAGLLIKNSEASLDQLYQAVGDVGCNVILANREGVPLTRRGSPADDDTFESWGLWTGAIWSEASEGTNGVGTCIVEERPLTIHKDQHFHKKNIDLSCTAAPIFDHEGELIAVVDVSSCRSDLTSRFSKLISSAVINAARTIEANYFSEKFSSAKILLVPQDTTDASAQHRWQSAALIAVDQDDLIIGATRAARSIYKLGQQDLKNNVPLSSLLGHENDQAHRYATAEQRVIQQAIASTNGNISAAASALGISRATLHRKINKFRQSN